MNLERRISALEAEVKTPNWVVVEKESDLPLERSPDITYFITGVASPGGPDD